jgi:menaquinone-specific isochorismate synthase
MTTHPDAQLAAVRPRLFAHSEPVRDGEQLLDHLGPDGAVWLDGARDFVTAGAVATVSPAEAVSTLRAIEYERSEAVVEAGVIGPRAVGALPFGGGGRMIVPAHIVERGADGSLWRTEIGPATRPAATRSAATRPGGTRYTVTELTDAQAWAANVAAILALVDAGAAQKVVLAREVAVEADEPFDIAEVVTVLRDTQPGCVVYADHGFVGASPELLVRRSGRDVTARPMAGTAPHADELSRSDKDAREHQLVVDAVVGALAATCDDARSLGTAPVALTDLAHLATTISARVRDLDTSAVDLALMLHPTPAVAGTPRDTALAAIARLEATPRDLYAGPCGWVDATGDGEFVVALRGAQIDGNHARLHAGAGIVAGSQPDAEWAETQSKLEPMLRALVRP